MQIAMVGLGRMGANMVRRLQDGGHDCVGYDVAEEPIAELEAAGAERGAYARSGVSPRSSAPRHIWLMVPAAFVGTTIDRARTVAASRGDTLIDGGNSWYRDDVDRAGPLATAASTTSTSAPAAASSASSAATA